MEFKELSFLGCSLDNTLTSFIMQITVKETVLDYHERFSNLIKLIRTITLVLSFIKNTRYSNKELSKDLSTEELDNGKKDY